VRKSYLLAIALGMAIPLAGCGVSLQDQIATSVGLQSAAESNVRVYESIAYAGLSQQSLPDQTRLAPLRQDATLALDTALAVWADVNAGASAAGRLDIQACIRAVMDAWDRVQAVVDQYRVPSRTSPTLSAMRVRMAYDLGAQ
jgi:hypothetical protein